MESKGLSLSYSYYEPKNNGIKFGDARHTFSCLVFSYFSFLTQHSLVRPLNPNTCLRSFSWSHWVISMSQSLQQCLVCVSFFFKTHTKPLSHFFLHYQPQSISAHVELLFSVSAHGFRIKAVMLEIGNGFPVFVQLNS